MMHVSKNVVALAMIFAIAIGCIATKTGEPLWAMFIVIFYLN